MFYHRVTKQPDLEVVPCKMTSNVHKLLNRTSKTRVWPAHAAECLNHCSDAKCSLKSQGNIFQSWPVNVIKALISVLGPHVLMWSRGFALHDLVTCESRQIVVESWIISAVSFRSRSLLNPTEEVPVEVISSNCSRCQMYWRLSSQSVQSVVYIVSLL